MSGYLEIKYPFKSNLGLYPFKSWKRQWCILRPSPTCAGASLAVYCSEAGASAGTVELPSGCVVKRAKSRTRPYAFAVFSDDEPRKPRVLLAAQTLHDAQVWMEKIRTLLNGSKLLESEPVLKDSYSVTVVGTELSRRCGVCGDALVTLTSRGVLVARERRAVLLPWGHVADVLLAAGERHSLCVLYVDRQFQGGGELKLSSPLASALVLASVARAGRRRARSDTDLSTATATHSDLSDERRTSWYSGPSEVSLDDIDLVMSKEWKHIEARQLSRYNGATLAADIEHDDSVSDRRSLASVASGIYEEIPDLPDSSDVPLQDIIVTRDLPDTLLKGEEPAYECVESLFGTTRRRPPPLPPRHRALEVKSSVTRHSSLGSLPRTHSLGAKTLPKLDKRQPFSVFRKRLKSDSRLLSSQKSEPSKENKDIDTKKKKFDFTPTRDIFKSFKVNRKKNTKHQTNLSKGETKSCEFLDDAKHIQTNRCSKSVECLENDFDFEADLSIELDKVDSVAALSLPQQIVDLILNHEQLNKVRLRDAVEGDYMPMSPIIPPPPIEHHYIVMSPRTNIV